MNQASDSMRYVFRDESVESDGEVDQIRQQLGRKGRAVLRGGSVESDSELDQIRQKMGRKRSVSQFDRLEMSICEDLSLEKFSKNFNIADRMTHYSTDDGMSEAGSQVPPASLQQRVRKPGAFKNGYSEFTVSQNHKKEGIDRYGSEVPQRLRRAVSLPPERFKTDVVSNDHLEQMPPATASQPKTARRSTYCNSVCTAGGVDVALRRETSADLSLASEQRKLADAEFAKKCADTRTACVEANNVAKSTQRRIHHRGSASVGSLLRWE
jgi:hypothetical protein